MIDVKSFESGLPLDGGDIVDCHCHFGPCRDFDLAEWSADSVLRSMDAIGIGKALISSNLSLGADFAAGNAQTASTVSAFPDRFIGYVTFNPNYPREGMEDIEKYASAPGMSAIKIHPTFHEYPIDGTRYQALYGWAHERRRTILCHTWGNAHIAAIERAAARYPQAAFIMGHSGGTPQAVKDALAAAERTPNLFLDLACSLQYDRLIESACGILGSERVLFGTDVPYVDPRPSVGRIFYADIAEKEKENIFGKNILRLLAQAQ